MADWHGYIGVRWGDAWTAGEITNMEAAVSALGVHDDIDPAKNMHYIRLSGETIFESLWSAGDIDNLSAIINVATGQSDAIICRFGQNLTKEQSGNMVHAWARNRDTDDLFVYLDCDIQGYGSAIEIRPGAEVYHVTNLDDNGAGSLREAVITAPENGRFIVFDIAGTINLADDSISRSYIEATSGSFYILGQTAPAGGVCLRGSLIIRCDNVLVRHLRIRPGAGALDPDSSDCATITNANRVVFDHCSMSWSTDELWNIWADDAIYGTVQNVTLQWCMLSEGLYDADHSAGPHSMGPFLGGGSWSRVSMHHNIIAHNYYRNPIGRGNDSTPSWIEFSNNVIYDAHDFWFYNALQMNLIANYYKYNSGQSTRAIEYRVQPRSNERAAISRLYQSGNISEDAAGNQRAATVAANEHNGEVIPCPENQSRLDMPYISTTSAIDAYAAVLTGAGATLPQRDSVDARIISQIEARTGGIIDDPSEVGGWPDLTA